MDIIVCYKVIPEEQDMSVLPDRTLSFEDAELKMGQYDLNAVEEGVRLVEKVGGKVSALTIGGEQAVNSKLKKDILSRGPDELYTVIDNSLENADSYLTAQAIAAAVKKMDQFDLILCGEGSSDLYDQQVGIQLGEILNIPILNGISKITPKGDKVKVERTLESEIEVIEVTLPAVLSVSTDINVTRVPSMKDILSAGRKPSTSWKLDDLDLKETNKNVETLSTLVPEQVDREQVIIEGDDEDQLTELFDHISKVL